MSMDSWFPNPHDKDIAQLEEGLAYRAIKSGNNWILPSGKNAANGDPVVLDGIFGYATAAIVGGTDAIVEDTNWKPYGDGGALGALNSNPAILYNGLMTKNQSYDLNDDYTNYRYIVVVVRGGDFEKSTFILTESISSSYAVDVSLLTETGTGIYLLVRLLFTSTTKVKAENIAYSQWGLQNIRIYGIKK